MRLSIVIVTWNVREYTLRCLESIKLAKGPVDTEVIVVDNASRDGTVEAVHKAFPKTNVIARKDNAGFARANNEGIAHATGEIVLVLNPDTIVHPNALSQIVAVFSADPAIGIIAPRIVNNDGSFQRGSQRSDPTLLTQLIILLKLQRLLQSSSWISQYYRDSFDDLKEQECEQPMGAAFAIRRDTFERIGRFDETFFLWFEEVDLFKRARSMGIRCRYIPTISIVHYGGASFSQRLPLTKQWRYAMSALHYFYKHEGIFSATCIIVVVPFSLFLALIQQFVSPHVRPSR